MKRKKKRLFALALACVLLLPVTGCKKSDAGVSDNISDESTDNTGTSGITLSGDFDEYLNNVFIHEAQCDTLSLHYLIAHPENYGITTEKVTLGEYSYGVDEEDYAELRAYLTDLEHYDYESLTDTQKTTYNIFKKFVEDNIKLLDYACFAESLGPTTGLQAQLPVLLAEYTFYDVQDVDDYIALLNDMPAYFSQIAQAQKDKSSAGYFMSDSTADEIISQCESFIADPENNLLIECFNAKISSVPDITTDQITLYTENNRDAVLNSVIPAYQTLIDTLVSLKGTGTNELGVCGFENGAEYYELSAQLDTGSSMSITEMEELLKKRLQTAALEMTTLQLADPTLLNKLMTVKYPSDDPAEIVEYLKSAMSEDFPVLEEVNYDINYVHESLQEYLSPAFYLIPPIDEVILNNHIYINASEGDSLEGIFPTIAHEGYPGHLYQTVYFFRTNPSMIRRLTEPSGYIEGWATYVEYYSYDMADFNSKLADFMQANMIATQCLYSLTDIGINYHGWTLKDTKNFWSVYGVDGETAKLIHDMLVAEPGAYLPYSIGCLELLQLREKAEEALGDSFVAKDFHQVILEAGAMPFDMLEVFVDEYISEVNKTLAPAA